jgi:hypothetical protein
MVSNPYLFAIVLADIAVGIDPELRLHRIGSGPTMTTGDVMEGDGMHEKRHASAPSPELAQSDTETTGPTVGGGRHDQ